jgi:hypothetical protein
MPISSGRGVAFDQSSRVPHTSRPIPDLFYRPETDGRPLGNVDFPKGRLI